MKYHIICAGKAIQSPQTPIGLVEALQGAGDDCTLVLGDELGKDNSLAVLFKGVSVQKAPGSARNIIIVCGGGVNETGMPPAKEYAASLTRTLAMINCVPVGFICVDSAWGKAVNDCLKSTMPLAAKEAFPRGKAISELTHNQIPYKENTLFQARLMMLLVRLEIVNETCDLVDVKDEYGVDRLDYKRKVVAENDWWRVYPDYVMLRQQDFRFELSASDVMTIRVRNVFAKKGDAPLKKIREWVEKLSKMTFSEYASLKEVDGGDIVVSKKVATFMGENADNLIIWQCLRSMHDVKTNSEGLKRIELENPLPMFPSFSRQVDGSGATFSVVVDWENSVPRSSEPRRKTEMEYIENYTPELVNGKGPDFKRDYSLGQVPKKMGFTLEGLVEYVERVHEKLIFMYNDTADTPLFPRFDFFDWGQDVIVAPVDDPWYAVDDDFVATFHFKPKIDIETEEAWGKRDDDDDDDNENHPRVSSFRDYELAEIGYKVNGIPHTPFYKSKYQRTEDRVEWKFQIMFDYALADDDQFEDKDNKKSKRK